MRLAQLEEDRSSAPIKGWKCCTCQEINPQFAIKCRACQTPVEKSIWKSQYVQREIAAAMKGHSSANNREHHSSHHDAYPTAGNREESESSEVGCFVPLWNAGAPQHHAVESKPSKSANRGRSKSRRASALARSRAHDPDRSEIVVVEPLKERGILEKTYDFFSSSLGFGER
jgi:hypothetical protein